MEAHLAITAAYERLLGELSRRLGANHAELLLHVPSGDAARLVARSVALDARARSTRWLEIPINEGAREVGRLCLAFADGASLPDPSEQAMAQALVELVALLVEEHHQLVWGPLRQAGRRILAVTEEELQRIILDIHDGPVQKLFAVSSHLALLQAHVDECPAGLRDAIAPTLERLTLLLEGALHDIRTTLSGFRLAEFQRRPLPEVLRGLALEHETLTGNQVELQIDEGLPPVSLAVKIALYRVLQEGLSNAYRHAGVDRHAVRVSQHDGWVALEVSDRGRGFEPPPLEGPAATERQEHIGLRGMRERIQLVGGHLQVISRPGHGTRVIVHAPSDS